MEHTIVYKLDGALRTGPPATPTNLPRLVAAPSSTTELVFELILACAPTPVTYSAKAWQKVSPAKGRSKGCGKNADSASPDLLVHMRPFSLAYQRFPAEHASRFMVTQFVGRVRVRIQNSELRYALRCGGNNGLFINTPAAPEPDTPLGKLGFTVLWFKRDPLPDHKQQLLEIQKVFED